MDKGSLLKRLAGLGFSLLEPDKGDEANATLADLVESRDYRLWEGFPVVLANIAENGVFDYDKVEGCLKSRRDRDDLALLVMFSLALYKTLGLELSWRDKLYALFDNADVKKKYEEYLLALKNNRNLVLPDGVMSSQRVKSTFNNYFKREQVNLDDLLSAKEAMAVEYSLSQVFSPKQKELFLRRLRNEKMSKTEKEYFSRTVKKKVSALANSELHRLAQKLLQ